MPVPTKFQLPLPELVSPSVSIVVNNYNYGRFLEQAIASALAQTYPCEVVVVDDGSTDESPDVLARFSERVQRVIQKSNGGQYSAYNAGFAASTGDVVVFLDADDWLYPDAVKTAVRAFGEGVTKVHFRLELVNHRGQKLGPRVPNSLADGDVASRMLRHGILYASAPGSGNAYRRSALHALFPLPEPPSDRTCADFFTIFGSGLLGRVAALELPQGAYRVHTAAPESDLAFGNGAQRNEEYEQLLRRVDLFRVWMRERTGIEVPPLEDFSQQKTRFAATLLERRYLPRLREGARALPGLFRTLWRQGEYSLEKKLGLSAWCLLVTCAPGRIARPVARYVTNPASRSA